MTHPLRPTLRCLTEDLELPLPSLDESLDQLAHALLDKARLLFGTDAPRERIGSIDDNVLLKCKVGRWRGAVWQEAERADWLCAAGIRRDGSPEDSMQHSRTNAVARGNSTTPTTLRH